MSGFHVAFFNRSFHPDTTATGQLLTELCEGLLREHGCRVSVVAGVPFAPSSVSRSGRRQGVLVLRDRHHGIEVLRARGTRFSKSRFAGRFSNYVTYFLSACYAGLLLDRPDVVVALTDPPIIGLAGYVAARRFGVPLVMWYQDIFPEVARLLEDFQSNTVERVLQAVNCFLVRKASRNVAIGESMRRNLIAGKGARPEGTVVIPNWADCTAMRSGSRDNAFTRRHGLAEKFVVMHSGNIGLSQGLDVLIDAAVYLRDLRDVVVVLVGEGVKKSALQKRARTLGLDNVLFLPFQPREALAESFSSADVFVVSLRPGLDGYIVPSKLYGILAAGKPYVAAVEKEGEIAAVTLRYECGLVAPPTDPERVAEMLRMLHDDHALASRLGANARKAALDFDRPVQIRAHYELLKQAACPTV